MRALTDLKIKLFADGADRKHIAQWLASPLISGFTTNPTLMRAAGITDYETFARDILQIIADRPISFEVFADDFTEMERQAHKIASWGGNVYVKLPITNTRGESAMQLAGRLAHSGVKVNVTAVLTMDQVRCAAAALRGGAPSVISIFAGRIADTGRDPIPMMKQAVELVSDDPDMELIWASPRELLNIFQANDVGCHIITVTESILAKLQNIGKDLNAISLDTVAMFHTDASRSGYQL